MFCLVFFLIMSLPLYTFGFIYIYVYIHTKTYAHVYINRYIQVPTCIYTCIYTYMQSYDHCKNSIWFNTSYLNEKWWNCIGLSKLDHAKPIFQPWLLQSLSITIKTESNHDKEGPVLAKVDKTKEKKKRNRKSGLQQKQSLATVCNQQGAKWLPGIGRLSWML